MSTVTIAGLPVLAIIEDTTLTPPATHGDEPKSPRPLPTGRPPGKRAGRQAQSAAGRSSRGQREAHDRLADPRPDFPRGGHGARRRRGKSGMQCVDCGERQAHRGHGLQRLCHEWSETLREHDAELRRIHHHRPGRRPPNGASTGHYGLRASKAGGIKVENCNVTGYERGLYFSSVHSGSVKHSNFYGNTRYGANLAGPDSYGMLFDANTYSSNGNEGIHVSGPMTKGSTKPNKFINSTASGNVGEGFYLLNANNVVLDQITTFDNGQAGIYVKHSPNVVISHAHLMGDMMHVYGNSDAGAYSWITIDGGTAQVAEGQQRGREPELQHVRHICVHYDAANGQPEAAFYFEGVTAGSNSITNSKAALIAGKNSVVAINGTTGIAVTSLYISPPTITTRVDGTSSFTRLTTQTTTSPMCY